MPKPGSDRNLRYRRIRWSLDLTRLFRMVWRATIKNCRSRWKIRCVCVCDGCMCDVFMCDVCIHTCVCVYIFINETFSYGVTCDHQGLQIMLKDKVRVCVWCVYVRCVVHMCVCVYISTNETFLYGVTSGHQELQITLKDKVCVCVWCVYVWCVVHMCVCVYMSMNETCRWRWKIRCVYVVYDIYAYTYIYM